MARFQTITPSAPALLVVCLFRALLFSLDWTSRWLLPARALQCALLCCVLDDPIGAATLCSHQALANSRPLATRPASLSSFARRPRRRFLHRSRVPRELHLRSAFSCGACSKQAPTGTVRASRV